MGRISPAFFLIVIIGFFLPFVRISCDGQEVARIRGFKFVTGGDVEMPMLEQMTGMEETNLESSQAEKGVDPEIYAIIAFACAVVGLILGIVMMKKSPVIPGIIGIVGFVMLLLLKFKLDGKSTG